MANICLHLVFLDTQSHPAVSIKEELPFRASSDQGEEEMEVDSADDQEEEARNQGGQTQSQMSKSKTGATFNTFSSFGSLRPGIFVCVNSLTLLNITTVPTSQISTV